MTRTQGFAPILGATARVLILGTLPSRQSLLRQQYYGHPRNAFWPIMGSLFGAEPAIPYAERTQILAGQGVAIWDVLQSASRPGSMDAAIDTESAVPNNFRNFRVEHPELKLVCFNGMAAEKLFRKRVAKETRESYAAVRFVTMPSTSPAHAAMTHEQKLERWAQIAVV